METTWLGWVRNQAAMHSAGQSHKAVTPCHHVYVYPLSYTVTPH